MLRVKLTEEGYTVNRYTIVWRVYVLELDSSEIKDCGEGYVYVGETSATLEIRLKQHCRELLSKKGKPLWAKSQLDWENKTAIQHFVPLKPLDPEYWGHLVAPMDTVDGEPDYEDLADSWGNLGLIERSLLNAVEREDWPGKISGLGDGKHDGLSKSKFKLTQAVCTQQKWTRALINHRSEWL